MCLSGFNSGFKNAIKRTHFQKMMPGIVESPLLDKPNSPALVF